jgi:hypothetical protein
VLDPCFVELIDRPHLYKLSWLFIDVILLYMAHVA